MISESGVSHGGGPLTDSRLAALCAETIEGAFRDYEAQFASITQRARERFVSRDWANSHADARERLHLYTAILDQLTDEVAKSMGSRLCDRGVWSAIKAVYSSRIAHMPAWEIGESFFNSLTRRVFATEGVDQAIEFVDTDFDAPPVEAERDAFRRYSGGTAAELLLQALTDTEQGGFSADSWSGLESAVPEAARRIALALEFRADETALTLELIRSTFYRGRGAYLVGRVGREADSSPGLSVAISLRNSGAAGIKLDALLLGERDLAILFSYTRAYFRVETGCPFQLVRYLRELMPRKRLVDLYNGIGFHRHGKTELYRDFVAHLRGSNDRFVAAEGTRGMVMLVFTLPSYDVVFKLIRDRFDYPKESSADDVKKRYRLVFEHDRAGRLIEAHEFEHLRIGRERFEPALLDELCRDAAKTVKLDGDDVVISHAYIERRIRPLNLFFKEADSEASVAAACDYGQAIKDMAASNIFAGDLLTKNFGVTRTGRVVFYDYDELCFLTDCNFRDMPQPTTPEQEMAAEPWFSVRENDIFPEEFPNFLAVPERARLALMARHGDLFEAEYWRAVQRRLKAGEIPEIFPYAAERRLVPAAI
ncbi:bifunctional isocitrate dehydrogenase kinase/phosphatase [soil metagenome]